MEQTDSGKRGLFKEGERTSPGTYMKDSCTWTTGGGLTMKVGGQAGQREPKGEIMAAPVKHK